MAFAEKLKALRLENHLTQEYVAEQMNVARSTIAGYETKNRQPSHEKLMDFANFFHVSVDYLLDNEKFTHLSITESRTVSEEALALFERYQQLSSRSKKDLWKHLHLLELQDAERKQDKIK